MSLRPLFRALGALFRSRRADAEVADEVAHYLDEAAAAHRDRGLSPEAARRAARLEVGSPVAVRDEVRSSGWEHVVEASLRDVRYALRKLIKSPVFTVTAVLTLAIGIGASTAVFSAVHPVLIEPLPFPDAARLVTLDDWTSDGEAMPSHARDIRRGPGPIPLVRSPGGRRPVASFPDRNRDPGTGRGPAGYGGLFRRVRGDPDRGARAAGRR